MTMRRLKGLLAVLVAAGLTGCGAGGPSAPPAGGPSATAQRGAASAPPPVKPASPVAKAQARAAAMRFYGLYSASRFASSWSLLPPAVQHLVLRRVWVGVHQACPSAGAGEPRVIKAVTVFGTAAIITEAISGATAKADTAEDVFDNVSGRWRYSPQDLSIYQHGSVAADTAAAKAAGFCGGRKLF